MTMRAVVAHGAGDLRVEDVPVPDVEAGAVLVRVAFGGICGTDLHYYQHGRNGIYDLRRPLVLGHEIVGTITAVGAGVGAPYDVGAAVALHPARPTPKPGATKALGLHLAPGGSYLGSASTDPHTDGGFAEYVAVDADQIRLLPAGLPLRRAVLAEPLAVAIHGVAQAGDVRGRTVLVSGAGPIGCLSVAALRAGGAGTIVVTDLAEEPLRIARGVGATRTVRLGGDAVLEEESFDVVVEASGAPVALASALGLVRRGGTIVQLGMLPAGDLSLPMAALVSREITLRGSQRFELELDDAIALLAATPELELVVTHEFPIDQGVDAFDAAASSSVAGKVVIAV